MATGDLQGFFDFSKTTSGYQAWIASRTAAMSEVARKLHLPIGHQVEVWLVGGIRLRGKLRLQEEVLLVEEDRIRHLGLEVDHVKFAYREIDSCVRLD